MKSEKSKAKRFFLTFDLSLVLRWIMESNLPDLEIDIYEC